MERTKVGNVGEVIDSLKWLLLKLDWNQCKRNVAILKAEQCTETGQNTKLRSPDHTLKAAPDVYKCTKTKTGDVFGVMRNMLDWSCTMCRTLLTSMHYRYTVFPCITWPGIAVQEWAFDALNHLTTHIDSCVDVKGCYGSQLKRITILTTVSNSSCRSQQFNVFIFFFSKMNNEHNKDWAQLCWEHFFIKIKVAEASFMLKLIVSLGYKDKWKQR